MSFGFVFDNESARGRRSYLFLPSWCLAGGRGYVLLLNWFSLGSYFQFISSVRLVCIRSSAQRASWYVRDGM